MAESVQILFPQPQNYHAKNPSTTSVPEGSHRVYYIYDNSGGPRHSQSIFLESNEYGEGSGTLLHVIGNIVNGMIFETRVDLDPTQSPSFENRIYLGSTLSSDNARLEAICRDVEVPGKQLRPNGKTIDHSKPVRVLLEDGMFATCRTSMRGKVLSYSEMSTVICFRG